MKTAIRSLSERWGDGSRFRMRRERTGRLVFCTPPSRCADSTRATEPQALRGMAPTTCWREVVERGPDMIRWFPLSIKSGTTCFRPRGGRGSVIGDLSEIGISLTLGVPGRRTQDGMRRKPGRRTVGGLYDASRPLKSALGDRNGIMSLPIGPRGGKDKVHGQRRRKEKEGSLRGS